MPFTYLASHKRGSSTRHIPVLWDSTTLYNSGTESKSKQTIFAVVLTHGKNLTALSCCSAAQVLAHIHSAHSTDGVRNAGIFLYGMSLCDGCGVNSAGDWDGRGLFALQTLQEISLRLHLKRQICKMHPMISEFSII